MFNFVQTINTLSAFLPPWFVVMLLATIAVMMSILVFKLVAFIMDVIPFI